ncbi:hypothetical protein [Cysteiniphilum sp. 6C5]|uniref:hypothetical protein n=1 Tax=unclassified Cysteiniphilum TaxID=2610889 RepID=UPI003F87D45D
MNYNKSKISLLIAANLITIAPIYAHTFNLGQVGVDISGFASTGMTTSTSSTPYAMPGHGTIDNHPNFATPSLLGLQLSADLGSGFSAVGQVVANGDSTNGHNAFNLTTPWLYLAYKVNSNLRVSAGRMQLPSYMYSQQIDVGYSYPYAFLPNEVYRIIPFYSFNGVKADYTINLNQNWQLTLSPFYGQNDFKYDAMMRLAPTLQDKITLAGKAYNLIGSSVDLNNGSFSLHGAYLYSKVDVSATVNGQTNNKNGINAQFLSLGSSWNIHNLMLSAEVAYRKADPMASLLGEYMTIGYNTDNWLPYISIANLHTTNSDTLNNPKNWPTEIPENQTTLSVGLNRYIAQNIVLKGEYSYIMPHNGQSGLFYGIPNGNVSMLTLSASVVF